MKLAIYLAFFVGGVGSAALSDSISQWLNPRINLEQWKPDWQREFVRWLEWIPFGLALPWGATRLPDHLLPYAVLGCFLGSLITCSCVGFVPELKVGGWN
jgi:hypothetical protein